MTPPSRRRLDTTGKSGVSIVFSLCRVRHAAQPAHFLWKNMLVPQRGDADIANTQYVHHFCLLGRGVVGMGWGSFFDEIFIKKAL